MIFTKIACSWGLGGGQSFTVDVSREKSTIVADTVDVSREKSTIVADTVDVSREKSTIVADTPIIISILLKVLSVRNYFSGPLLLFSCLSSFYF